MSTYDAPLAAILDREPAADIFSEEVKYTVKGVDCLGYFARPNMPGSYPGVLVVHDWMGVTDQTKMRCDMLARIGYSAFAADIYGADVRPSESEAAEVSGQYYGDKDLFRERVVGAYDRMLGHEGVEVSKTAAMGYCFGGSAALELARTGRNLNGVVSFHGRLETGPEGEAENIKASVMVLTGGIDPVVPDEDVKAFEDEMRTVPTLDWQLTSYANSMHAFTNPYADAPNYGAKYNEKADLRSWQAMKDFFAEVL